MLDTGAPHRAAHEERFFDVHHADFHAHPMRVIGEIYDRFGLVLSADTERRMTERIAANPEGQGVHRYDLDSFGLTEEMIRQFRIGFAPDSGFLLRDRLRSEFTEELLRESGMFSWKESTRPMLPSRLPDAARLGSNRSP